MATFNLTEYLEDDGILLKGVRSEKHPDGGEYRFASPPARIGLWLKNLIEFGQRAALGLDVGEAAAELPTLDDDAERDIYRQLMGDTLDQMLDDGVSWERVQKVFVLLLKKWGQGQDVAVTLQEAQGEAVARPNRQARRASAKSSSPKAGSKSSRASSATKARTSGRASTRSSGTSAAKPVTKAV